MRWIIFIGKEHCLWDYFQKILASFDRNRRIWTSSDYSYRKELFYTAAVNKHQFVLLVETFLIHLPLLRRNKLQMVLMIWSDFRQM